MKNKLSKLKSLLENQDGHGNPEIVHRVVLLITVIMSVTLLIFTFLDNGFVDFRIVGLQLLLLLIFLVLEWMKGREENEL